MSAAPPEDDFTLLALWRDGDSDAGNELVRRHFSVVFRFFANKANDDAPDLTQQTFLALVEQRTRVDPTIALRAYVLGVARHKLVHHLRHHYRHTAVFSPEHVSAVEAQPDPASSPTRRLAADEQRSALELALRALPLDHQIALELHYWHEMALAEIATVLECTPGSVKSRLFRARKALQQHVRRLSANPAPVLADLDSAMSSIAGDPDPA